MEVNKEEAQRSLAIAARKRAAGQLDAARRFAAKSVSLYPTPEAEALVKQIDRELASGASGETSSAGSESMPGASRASGVEEHLTSAQQRHKKPAPAAASEKDKEKEAPKAKREYTVKQLEVVKRIRKCRDHQYYEILAIEKTCTENEVKRAYKKLALALHPDKNGAPGADEAFKSEYDSTSLRLSSADMSSGVKGVPDPVRQRPAVRVRLEPEHRPHTARRRWRRRRVRGRRYARVRRWGNAPRLQGARWVRRRGQPRGPVQHVLWRWWWRVWRVAVWRCTG
jgi:DnaJ family protein B protein 12